MGSTVMVIVRVTPGVHWHALEDDLVVGRGHALHRPDGRVFVSVDSWRDDVFEALAHAMADDLRRPLYTVMDEDDREHLGRWSVVGYVDNRREIDYAISTDAPANSLKVAPLPRDSHVIRADAADENRLRELDQQLRQAMPGFEGWVNTPEEFHRFAFDHRIFDPALYLVAIHTTEYAGLIRIGRGPRLVLVGVLPEHRRRGLARALLAMAFTTLHERGVTEVSAGADVSNREAIALLTSLGGRRTGGSVELVHRP
jgi:ribosomal protein S18 acetylase RimI-like enzyme